MIHIAIYIPDGTQWEKYLPQESAFRVIFYVGSAVAQGWESWRKRSLQGMREKVTWLYPWCTWFLCHKTLDRRLFTMKMMQGWKDAYRLVHNFSAERRKQFVSQLHKRLFKAFFFLLLSFVLSFFFSFFMTAECMDLSKWCGSVWTYPTIIMNLKSYLTSCPVLQCKLIFHTAS